MKKGTDTLNAGIVYRTICAYLCNSLAIIPAYYAGSHAPETMADTGRGSEHDQEGVSETSSTIESLRNLQQVNIEFVEQSVVG